MTYMDRETESGRSKEFPTRKEARKEARKDDDSIANVSIISEGFPRANWNAWEKRWMSDSELETYMTEKDVYKFRC